MATTLLAIRTGILGFCFFSTFSLTGTFLKIGHRGACGLAPENTLMSFQKAFDCGVDMIELDVHICASGELVVVHDAFLPDCGYVTEATLAELKALDVGQGQCIPTLAEVCDLIDRRIMINVELKGRGTAGPTARFIQKYVLEKKWAYENFFVSSFDHHQLKCFRELLPYVSTGALLTGVPLTLAACGQELGANTLVAHVDFVNRLLVEDAHARGMSIFVFTVNYPSEIERIKQLGVDGIFSNYPDLF